MLVGSSAIAGAGLVGDVALITSIPGVGSLDARAKGFKEQLAAKYPGTKFRSDRKPLSEDELIDYLKGYDAAVIGLDRFTEKVCASLPDLKVVSLCSAGADHMDPAVLNKHSIRMWWAAGINKISVSELAVAYMVMTIRRVHYFSAFLNRGEWKGPMGFGADLRGNDHPADKHEHAGQDDERQDEIGDRPRRDDQGALIKRLERKRHRALRRT